MFVRIMILTLSATLVCSLSLAQINTYTTGYEADETPPFEEGTYEFGVNDDIDGSGNWIVEAGSAAIQSGTVSTDLQALEIQANGVVNAPLAEGDSGTATEIWLQGYYRTDPQDADPEVTELGNSSALMYFNSTQGIKVYNGAANPAAWEALDPPFAVDAGTWYLVTIRLDFSNQLWDIFINDELRKTGIGFKDALTSYSGFRCRSSEQGRGYLDDFYLSQSKPSNILDTPTPTPTVTETPTATVTPTATPTRPSLSAQEFLLYSKYWQGPRPTGTPEPQNETDFQMYYKLNLDGNDIMDWSDIYTFMGYRKYDPAP